MQQDIEIIHDDPDDRPDIVVTYNANALLFWLPPTTFDPRD